MQLFLLSFVRNALGAVRLQTRNDTFLIPAITLALALALYYMYVLMLLSFRRQILRIPSVIAQMSKLDPTIPLSFFISRTAINTFCASSVTPITLLPMSVRGQDSPAFRAEPAGKTRNLAIDARTTEFLVQFSSLGSLMMYQPVHRQPGMTSCLLLLRHKLQNSEP